MDDLLHRCLDGDPEARDRFVDRHAPIVFSMVRRVTRAGAQGDPSTTVEDIAQEVFLKLFREDAHLLRSYDPSRASLATWIAVIARSTALDMVRKKRLPTTPIESAEQTPAPEGGPKTSGPTSAVPTDLLPPRQRLVLQLIYDRGLAVAEVARMLGIEPQSVRSAKHKALTMLRTFFAESQEREEGERHGDAPRRPAVERSGGEGR